MQVCVRKRDKEWYFFTPRKKKYNGYWKATGDEAKAIMNNEGVVVGFKRDFVFYHGIPGLKTNWMMNEYSIGPLLLHDCWAYANSINMNDFHYF
ncbi:hypothetical protein LIER_04200 [Lithospermum erythrorhizon]|uniref:NAC domain-containing protein n=1 Tax=Lithospermum erythrorhizon TaxID=34254 RepID=A0AAV3NVU8_LITER